MQLHEIHTAWAGHPRCENCGIRHLVLFADLEQQDFALIHEPIAQHEVEVGEQLYRAGDEPEYVYTVRSGLLKLVHYLPDGSQRIVRLLHQGDVAGMEALLGEAYHHHAIALEPVEFCRIPVPVIERLSRETPRLHHQLLTRWQGAVAEAESWLTDLATGPAHARVARLLIQLADASPTVDCYIPHREDLGAMVGVTMETASRIIAEFKRKGFLRELGSNRARVDVDALKAEAEG
ncbi:MAG: Crp/Fnr family transcriptional regulator [Chromatiales bacterium]